MFPLLPPFFSVAACWLFLGVKYKCKFTSTFPDKPRGKKASLYFPLQKEGSSFKRKYIKSQTLPISFLSSARLYHTLIHLFLCSITPVDPSTPAAPQGTTVSDLLSLHEAPSKTSVERQCFWKPASWIKRLLTISRSCTLGLSQDRCLSTGSVEHQHHTGVLIRHSNNSVGGAVTDVRKSHSDEHKPNGSDSDRVSVPGCTGVTITERSCKRFRDRAAGTEENMYI